MHVGKDHIPPTQAPHAIADQEAVSARPSRKRSAEEILQLAERAAQVWSNKTDFVILVLNFPETWEHIFGPSLRSPTLRGGGIFEVATQAASFACSQLRCLVLL